MNKADYDRAMNTALELGHVLKPFQDRIRNTLVEMGTAIEAAGVPHATQHIGGLWLGLALAIANTDLGMSVDEIASVLAEMVPGFGQMHARAAAIAKAQSS